MQKDNKKIYQIFIILVLVGSFLINPFRILSENPTYWINTDATVYAYTRDTRTWNYYSSSDNVRFVFLNNNNNVTIWAISNSSGQSVTLHLYNNGVLSSNTTYNLNSSSLVNNVRYYYYRYTGTVPFNDSAITWYVPIVNTSSSFENAVYYSFGDGAIDPVEPVVMGDLVTGFYTQFATRGNNDDSIIAMRLNKDTITWDTTDSLGNDLSGILWVVDVRAVPVQYSSATKNNLLLQTISDVLLSTDTYDITTISASQGQFSITWGDLVDNYLENFGSLKQLFAMFNESEWIQKGWVYQVRLRSLSEDRPYEGQWQNVYNTTSSAPSDAQTIMNYYYYTNGNGLNPGVVNSIQNINTTNNTTNNWYVDDQEIDTDPDHSWIEKLIEALVSLVQSILDFFKGIFDGLVDLLLGLLDGFDPVGSFMGWWSDLLNGFNGIDLTLPEFNLPEIEGIESLSILPQKTIELFTDNGLGIVIFVPLILMILRLFL